MKLKQIPEDFVVDEIFDLKSLEREKEKDEKGIYYYFVFKKKDYSQLRALEKVANVFNVSRKMVHFAGTKDRAGITSQLISVSGIKEMNFEKNLEFFNIKVDDLFLEFVGRFAVRINLGDNLGNKFSIVLRDLSDEDVLKIKENSKEIEKKGVLNYFDSQRFGFAGNSDKIGLYVLKSDLENAVREILLSLPENPNHEHLEFNLQVKENWEALKNCDKKVIKEMMDKIPRFLRDEKKILAHLHNYKNDFPGAFRTVHKKLRTLYVNAYQSRLFNEFLDEFGKKNNGVFEDGNLHSIELVNFDCDFNTVYGKFYLKCLERDGISKGSFILSSMPELKSETVFRNIKIFPKKFELKSIGDDDLNLGKKKVLVSFELEKGAYATNVVKFILSENL